MWLEKVGPTKNTHRITILHQHLWKFLEVMDMFEALYRLLWVIWLTQWNQWGHWGIDLLHPSPEICRTWDLRRDIHRVQVFARTRYELGSNRVQHTRVVANQTLEDRNDRVDWPHQVFSGRSDTRVPVGQFIYLRDISRRLRDLRVRGDTLFRHPRTGQDLSIKESTRLLRFQSITSGSTR